MVRFVRILVLFSVMAVLTVFIAAFTNGSTAFSLTVAMFLAVSIVGLPFVLGAVRSSPQEARLTSREAQRMRSAH